MAIEEIEIEGFVGQNPKKPSEAYPDMLTFSVGVTQVYKGESKTTWYDVISYDKNTSAYLFDRLFKGDKVVVKGRPSLKTWKGKDGQQAATISITLRAIVLMKKIEDDTVSRYIREAPNVHPIGTDTKKGLDYNTILDDEIPF